MLIIFWTSSLSTDGRLLYCQADGVTTAEMSCSDDSDLLCAARKLMLTPVSGHCYRGKTRR